MSYCLISHTSVFFVDAGRIFAGIIIATPGYLKYIWFLYYFTLEWTDLWFALGCSLWRGRDRPPAGEIPEPELNDTPVRHVSSNRGRYTVFEHFLNKVFWNTNPILNPRVHEFQRDVWRLMLSLYRRFSKHVVSVLYTQLPMYLWACLFIFITEGYSATDQYHLLKSVWNWNRTRNIWRVIHL